MEWLILAVISWILFLLLVDWSALKRNIWCGLTAVLMQLLVDNTGISHGLYEIHKCKTCIAHSSTLFTFGPVIVVGVLLAQYFPKTRLMRLLNVLVLTTLYTAQEVLLLVRRNVVYTNWHFADSVGVNLAAMIILCWFTLVVMEKGCEKGR